MKKRKIFWGIFFVVMAMVVIVSKIGILPDVGVFSLLATVFLVWMAADGLKHRNFYEMMFAAAFLCIIYDEPLGIEALTPWTVLAAALLDNQRAEVVGETTLGKGSVQVTRELTWGGAVRYTAAYYLTPRGHAIDGVGIVPQVTVVTGDADGADDWDNVSTNT